MPSAIVATVGSASANSFVTTDEMDTYADDRANGDDWTGATSDNQARALITSAMAFDLLPWKGTRVDSTQALTHPRAYLPDPDLPWAVQEAQDSYYVSETEIHTRVKRAQMEYTLMILAAGTTDILQKDATLGVKRKKIDVMETEYFEPYSRPEGLQKYPHILNLLAPLLQESSGGMDVIRM